MGIILSNREREIVRRVIISLRDRPDEWAVDEFWARHSTGVRVWIANGTWGIRIESAAGGEHIGGVVVLASLMPWRRRLLNAALALQEKPRANFGPFDPDTDFAIV